MRKYLLVLVVIGALEFETFEFDEPEYIEKEDRPDIETPLLDYYESEWIREEKELEELAASYYF